MLLPKIKVFPREKYLYNSSLQTALNNNMINKIIVTYWATIYKNQSSQQKYSTKIEWKDILQTLKSERAVRSGTGLFRKKNRH